MLFVFLFLFIVFIWMIVLYNRFIRLEHRIHEAWSDVNVQLKRRYSLIPNLVEIVKGYMKYESKTLNQIVNSRNTALRQNTPLQKEKSENQITENLKHLFVVAEGYPKLKSNKQFTELSENLVEIENILQVARRYYNATVRDYNIALHSFPGNLLAHFLHLKAKGYFEIADFEMKNIKVNLHEK